jgi:hypothetical protein
MADPKRKKLDIAKILADPEKAIADLLSSPDILNKIPEALAKLPDEAKKALAVELFKYLPAAVLPAAETSQVVVDYQVLAKEVIKQMPQPDPGPTIEQIAAAAAKLVQFPSLDDIVKKLSEIIPHPIEGELVDKVTAKIAVQTTERFNKLDGRIADFERVIKDNTATLDKTITEKTELNFRQHADELKKAIQEIVSQEPRTNTGSDQDGVEKPGNTEQRPSLLGGLVGGLEPLLVLAEKYPKAAEMIINAVKGTGNKQEMNITTALSQSYRWHQVWKDLESGKAQEAIAGLSKEVSQQQPGT